MQYIILLVFGLIAILTGESHIISALIVIQLIFFTVFLSYYIKTNNVLFITISLVLFIKYIFIPLLINNAYANTISKFNYRPDSLISAQVITLTFTIFFFIGHILNNRGKIHQYNFSKTRLNFYAKSLLFALVIVGVLFSFRLYGELLTSDNRFETTSGQGILFFFGYAGYFLTCYFVYKYLNKKTKIYIVVFIAVLCGMFFLLRFHRGGFLYPLAFLILGVMGNKFETKKIIFVAVLLVPVLMELNIISSAIRSNVLKDSFSVDNIYESTIEENSNFTIPLAFGHIELLAVLEEKENFNSDYFSTLKASFFNWIPRSLIGSKPTSTGPILAKKIFPDTIQINGGYDSSLTTDLIVELFYNFKFLFFLPALFLGYLFEKVNRWVIEQQNYMFFIVFIWLFGFIVFFDDLGGWINKVFFIFIIGLTINYLNKLIVSK
ncbi:MAG TPA: hypothetical protein PLI97_02370 [Fluviicola sp.]|nr:hypothetical protein [Fluviicola sp.]